MPSVTYNIMVIITECNFKPVFYILSKHPNNCVKNLSSLHLTK